MKNKLNFCILGDIERKNIFRNIDKFFYLLTAIFKDIVNIEKHYFQANVSKINIYNYDNKNKEDNLKFLSNFHLLIFFEASEETLKKCANHNYINISIHPIRFCEDLMFSIKTNMDYDFSKDKVSDSDIKLIAQIIKSRIAWSDSRDSTMIIQQLPNDQSLYQDNKYYTFKDFDKELLHLSKKKLGRIYYKTHPYIDKIQKKFELTDLLFFRNNYSEEKYLKNFFNFTKISTNKSFYETLNDFQINKVISLSSSVIVESNYFDIEVVNLLKPKNYTKPISLINFIKSSFWKKFEINLKLRKNNIFENNNFLRKIFGNWNFYY